LRMLGLLPRFFLLIIISFKKINIYQIYGDGNIDKLLRYFSFYKLLGIWLLLGIIDYYLIRIPFLIFDFLYFLSSLVFNINSDDSDNNSTFSVGYILFLLFFYLIYNLCFILESHFSIYLIYRKGVWNNILSTLRENHKKKKLKNKSQKQKKNLVPLFGKDVDIF
jgi:hypothetical protein